MAVLFFLSFFSFLLVSNGQLEVPLTCRFNTDFDWLIIGRVYTCSVQGNVTVTDDSATVAEVRGEHRLFKGNNDVLALWLLKKDVHFLPRGIAKIFRHLAGLVVNRCGLKELRKTDMEPYYKLRELYLIENDLEMLESDTFEANKRLELIWLDGNKIKKIQPGIFDGLENLRFLNVRERSCMLRKVQYDREGVEKVVKQMKKKCPG